MSMNCVCYLFSINPATYHFSEACHDYSLLSFCLKEHKPRPQSCHPRSSAEHHWEGRRRHGLLRAHPALQAQHLLACSPGETASVPDRGANKQSDKSAVLLIQLGSAHQEHTRARGHTAGLHRAPAHSLPDRGALAAAIFIFYWFSSIIFRMCCLLVHGDGKSSQ